MKTRCKAIPKDQLVFIVDRNRGYLRDQPRLAELRKRLLEIGGEEVCLQFEREDIEKLMTRGREWSATNVKRTRGETNHCHSNAAFLWDANRRAVAVIVGWALSDDGIWRQHSFGWWRPKKRVVETTTSRVAYFGFRLTVAEARTFLEEAV